MSPAPYTEDILVQRTTADYLERQLGWESVYAYNSEAFGPEGTLGRRDDREVVLTRCLYLKLMELNPGLPDDVYDEDEVNIKVDDVFIHVFRAYPTVPSPYYAQNKYETINN